MRVYIDVLDRNLTPVQQFVKYLVDNNLIDLSDNKNQLEIDSAICKERQMAIHAHMEGSFLALGIKTDTYIINGKDWKEAEKYFYETYPDKLYRDEDL